MFHVISALSIAAFGLCIEGKLMSFITPCNRNSIDFSNCLTRTLKESWPRIVQGFPEDGFSSLEPWFIGYLKGDFETSQLSGKVTMANVTATGLTKMSFSNTRAHFLDDKFRFKTDYRMPDSFVDGDVSANGTLGPFRINTKGHFNITIVDIPGTWDLEGHIINDTAVVEHFINIPQIGKLKVHFHTQENQELYNIVVDFVNEYWPALYRIVLPVLSKSWESHLVNISNLLFSKVSFSEVFPE